MNCIQAGVPSGITNDQLMSDIEMLLENKIVSHEDLVEWSEKIDGVTKALNELNELTDKHLPKLTDGHCHGLEIGRNRLLSMFMNINYTHLQFVNEIQTIKSRVLKILAGKEQFKLFK